MAVVELIGLIALGAILFSLVAIATGGLITAMRAPRQRGLLSRLLLGEALTGLGELRRQDGLGGLFFGERRR